MKKIFLILFYFIILKSSFSQNVADTTKQNNLLQKIASGKLSGTFYTGFYKALESKVKPSAGFEIRGMLFMYKLDLSDKVSAIFAADVSRTSGNIIVKDSLGNPMVVSFDEGAKYTFWLKQAEICWKFLPFAQLNIGSIVTDQYLTQQDVFWGHRYIDVTMQEKNLYGMPSDLGAKLTLKYKSFMAASFSIQNGEGAKKLQDMNGTLLYSANLTFFPQKNTTLKIYADYEPKLAGTNSEKTTLVAFAGFKNKLFMLGVEFVDIYNFLHVDGKQVLAISGYAGINILERLELFSRVDRVIKGDINTYLIAGIQYEPIKRLKTSLNYRFNSSNEMQRIYLSFGFFL